MDRTNGHRAKGQPRSGDSCLSCGGSGVLRTDASGYRTCLDCLGQGSLGLIEATGFRAPPLMTPPAEELRGRVRRGGFRGEFSASTSGAR